jgi:hypothetical protein
MTSKKVLIAAASLLFALGGASVASAQDFAQTHPRRAEVNQRLAKQNQRIDAERASGAMSPAKAARLHAAVHRVRVSERHDARARGGHISRTQQARLNRRETRISRHIG